MPTASPVVRVKPATLLLSVPFADFLAVICSKGNTFDADGILVSDFPAAVCA
jgi:hypothetical protein